MTLFQLRGLPKTTTSDGTKVQVTAFGAETVPEAAPEPVREGPEAAE